VFYFIFQIIFKIVKSVALSKSREHFTLEYIALNNSRSDCLVKAVVHSLPSEGQALRTFKMVVSSRSGNYYIEKFDVNRFRVIPIVYIRGHLETEK